MQALAPREQDRHRDARPRGQAGPLLRERAEQEIGDERELGRDARVLVARRHVAGDGGQPDDAQRHGGDGHAADEHAQPADEPDERERPHAGGAAGGAAALVALALDAEQEAHAECHAQPEQVVAHRRARYAGRPASASAMCP